MSQPQDAQLAAGVSVSDPYWIVPVLRAIPALAIGLAITFIEDHSARVGLIAFGAFAIVTGLVIVASAIRLLQDRVVRATFVASGAIAAASGVAAIIFNSAGLAVLLFIVTLFAALTGALELYAGLRAPRNTRARDWVGAGAFTAVAAIVFVLIPADAVLATGLIGAYAVILGVYLVIAGLSLKWGTSGSSPRKVPA